MSSLTVPGPATPVTPQDWAELYRWPTAPTLRANMVTSLDGRSTVDGLSGGLSSAEDQELLKVLRATADVVVVGAGTVRAEGYDRFGTSTRLRRLLRPEVPETARLAVVTGSGLPDGLPALTTAARRPLILTTTVGASCTSADLGEIVVVGEERIDTTLLRAALVADGSHRLLCEGGPTLLGTLLDAGQVDELCLTHAPVIVGRSGRELLDATGAARWGLGHAVAAGDHLFTLHRLVR